MKRMRIAVCFLLLLLLNGCAKEAVTPGWAGQEKSEAAEKTDASGWQAQYDLGVRYLNDGNYEEAVIAFTAAIEIDPKRPEGYQRLADVFQKQEDYRSLFQTLDEGISQTGDTSLISRNWEIKAGILSEYDGIKNAATLSSEPFITLDLGKTGNDADNELEDGCIRSLLLRQPDGSPAVYQTVLRDGLRLYCYQVQSDGGVAVQELLSGIYPDYCGSLQILLYYNEKLECYCVGVSSDTVGAYTRVYDYYTGIYTITNGKAVLYHEWRSSSMDWNENYADTEAEKKAYGWPLLNDETLQYCYWMCKTEAWISGGEQASEYQYSRRYWSAQELEAYEKEQRSELQSIGLPEKPNSNVQLQRVLPENVTYFGDLKQCRLDTAAAEAYAAALDEMPETKTDEQGIRSALMAALVDPGDGYPLMLTCYANQSSYNGVWYAMYDPYAPYQIWGFNGETAERYPLEAESMLIPHIQFGAYEGKPAFCAQDGVSLVVGDTQGEVYYTVSQYRIQMQHHLVLRGAYVYDGDDPEYIRREQKTVQDYLDDGWSGDMVDGEYRVLHRMELDGVPICANKPDYERMCAEYSRIEDSFQPDAALEFTGSPLYGMLSERWSSAAAMRAALRGQPLPVETEPADALALTDETRADRSLYPRPERILQYGAEGEDVKYVQAMLVTMNYDGVPVDGVFGDSTEAALKRWQKRHAHDTTGIVDADTLLLLENAERAWLARQ